MGEEIKFNNCIYVQLVDSDVRNETTIGIENQSEREKIIKLFIFREKYWPLLHAMYKEYLLHSNIHYSFEYFTYKIYEQSYKWDPNLIPDEILKNKPNDYLERRYKEPVYIVNFKRDTNRLSSINRAGFKREFILLLVYNEKKFEYITYDTTHSSLPFHRIIIESPELDLLSTNTGYEIEKKQTKQICGSMYKWLPNEDLLQLFSKDSDIEGILTHKYLIFLQKLRERDSFIYMGLVPTLNQFIATIMKPKLWLRKYSGRTTVDLMLKRKYKDNILYIAPIQVDRYLPSQLPRVDLPAGRFIFVIFRENSYYGIDVINVTDRTPLLFEKSEFSWTLWKKEGQYSNHKEIIEMRKWIREEGNRLLNFFLLKYPISFEIRQYYSELEIKKKIKYELEELIKDRPWGFTVDKDSHFLGAFIYTAAKRVSIDLDIPIIFTHKQIALALNTSISKIQRYWAKFFKDLLNRDISIDDDTFLL